MTNQRMTVMWINYPVPSTRRVHRPRQETISFPAA